MTYDPGQYGQPQYGQPQYGQPPAHDAPAQPAYGAPAQQTPPGAGQSRRPLVLAAVGGFVLAAVIAVVLGAVGALPWQKSDDGTGRSDASVTLPKSVDGYGRFGEVGASAKPAAAESVAGVRATEKRTAAALSQAHGGAGAAVTTYASSDIATEFEVWAVRDASPTIVVPVQDPAYLGLAVAPQRVSKVGDAYCLIVQSQQVPAGQKINPDYDVPSICQRTGNGLTVEFHGGFGMTPAKAVAVVDKVWDDLS